MKQCIFAGKPVLKLILYWNGLIQGTADMEAQSNGLLLAFAKVQTFLTSSLNNSDYGLHSATRNSTMYSAFCPQSGLFFIDGF